MLKSSSQSAARPFTLTARANLQCSEESRLVDRTVRRTHTTALRFLTMLIFVLSIAAATLQLISVGTDEVVRFSLKTGVAIRDARLLNRTGDAGDASTVADSASGGTMEPLLLVPQMDVTVGYAQTCFGSQCMERSGVGEVVPLVLKVYEGVNAQGGLRPASLQRAYTTLIYQFATGFDLHAATCLEETDEKVSARMLSVFGIAAGSIATILLCATLAVSAYQAFFLARIDVLTGDEGLYADVESELMKLGTHQVSLRYLQQELDAHARCELPILIVLQLLMLLSFVFSTGAMAAGITLFGSKLRCGRSLCSSFTEASDSFFRELTNALGKEVAYRTACDRGVSFGSGVVAFVITTAVLALGFVQLVVYVTSGRHRSLARRKLAVDILAAEVARLKEDTASQLCAMAVKSSQTQTRSYSVVAPSILCSRTASGGQVGAARDGDTARLGRVTGPLSDTGDILPPSSHTDVAEPLTATFTPSNTPTPVDGALPARRGSHLDRLLRQEAPVLEPGLEHTLGGRIAMLRQRKTIMTAEEAARTNIKRTQALHFSHLKKAFHANVQKQ